MAVAAGLELQGLKERFERDGYLALEGFFSGARIDAAAAAMRRLLEERPSDVVVDHCVTSVRSLWSEVAGGETRHFKFNDLYLVSDEIRGLALDPELTAIMTALLGQVPVLCNSLNFEKGSSQPKHIDSLFMTPQTPHKLIASWTAFEDAHPDSGPLSYWPGSHRIPLYTFRDGSHHATAAELSPWYEYIEAQIRERGLEERIFLAKKGDVFLWHSDLLHGGTPIRDPNRTRKSLVCHYYSEADCRRMGSEILPLNGGLWLKRQRSAVKVDPAVFRAGAPFPEQTYLERYPDVAAAVRGGTCPSGKFHYETFGYAEGRGV
jgi:phytanoyl-CoA hydroxylase